MNCHISFISWFSRHIHNMKIINKMDNKFFGLKKKLISISLIAYVFTKVFMFIVHSICSALSCRLSAQFFSTTSSWLFCLLLFKHVVHTYSTAKAQDSPCSLCRPGLLMNIKEHFSLFLELWCFLGSKGNCILSCYHTQEQRLFFTSDC